MIKKLTTLIMVLFMMCGLSVPAFAAEPVNAVIPVSVTDECTIELKGISENTNGYLETIHGKDNIEFKISFDEPGDYKYEMRQIKDGSSDVYDDTVYNVWVSVMNEGDTMKTVITGGIANTNDKPDQFKFEKETPPEEKPKPEEPKTLDPVKTGDDTNISLWIVILLASIAGVGTILTHDTIEKRRNRSKGNTQ